VKNRRLLLTRRILFILSAGLVSISSILIALIFLALIMKSIAGPAAAPRPTYARGLWKAWDREPVRIVGLALIAFFYCRGAVKTRHQTSLGQLVQGKDMAWFAVGWLALVAAMISPVAALGESLFSAHAAQQGLLLLVAAPALALGRPLTALPWALPAGWRRRLTRAVVGAQARKGWRLMTGPFAAWLAYGAALWLWHMPALFQAAFEGGWTRGAQHLSLVVLAFVFYDALIRGRERQQGHGVTALYLAAACAHATLLGALLADASAPWYPFYDSTTAAWGRSLLEDQQLGGRIMWVSAVVLYAAAGLILFVAWLRERARMVPAEEKAILLDTDLWNSREWLMTRQEQPRDAR
jgi:putative membrane protein